MMSTDDALKALRAPFPDNQISKKPKETKQQKEERERDRRLGIRCQLCGQWHHKETIHLDYVGHAALTDRLLDVDPLWNWEPVSFTQDGQPAFDRMGGMWIKLTICGHTRLGYGHADGKNGGDAVKEVIGDALRNAAMRFGAALDLWHKGDLHPVDPNGENDDTTPGGESTKPPKATAADQKRGLEEIERELVDCRTPGDVVKLLNAWAEDAQKAGWSKDYWDEARRRFARRKKELEEASDDFPGDRKSGTGVRNPAGRELHNAEAF
ncbi:MULTISPECIES: hypothetical protein [unclassified Rhizobium]|uniref:hypothetical protein n=1 Tax=unclassified Rhizobium TaxID=2613769 RepID=UPI0016450D4A|nr:MULTISPECIES: hypothetical protein [unclassified Rhizobium]